MRTREGSCCFTGHRPVKLPWRYDEADDRCIKLKKDLAEAVEAAYQMGYRHFLCGMAMGCDFYFCECVLELRQKYSDITVEAAVPCPEQAARWGTEQRRRYLHLLEACDFRTVVSPRYDAGCMQRRDRYMIDRSSLLIAAFDGSEGGTRYTMGYAMEKGITIVDIQIPMGE